MIWSPHCYSWTMHLATVQCPPAAAMIRITLLMMAAPKTMAQTSFGPDERKLLTDQHNEIRKRVARGLENRWKKAANMEKMVIYNIYTAHSEQYKII